MLLNGLAAAVCADAVWNVAGRTTLLKACGVFRCRNKRCSQFQQTDAVVTTCLGATTLSGDAKVSVTMEQNVKCFIGSILM